MHRFRGEWEARGVAAAGLLILFLVTACIPYSVGTTAEPVAADKMIRTAAFTVMPPVSLDTSRGRSFFSIDYDMRWGIDSVSDMALRVVMLSGVTASYKRLLTRKDSPTLVAIMPGFGFVNLAEHAHFELTLLASRRAVSPAEGARGERSLVIPYGGIRVMQVAPLNSRAVHDQPTAGAFFGVRVGDVRYALSPEVGVFYDHSALGVRRRSLVVVPSISVNAEGLRRPARTRPTGDGRPRLPPQRPRPRI